MELRAITNFNELSELISASTFDEFYHKIVEENRRYDEEYGEAFNILYLRQRELGTIRRIVYKNWSVFRKIMELQHLARGIKRSKGYYQRGPFFTFYDSYRYQYVPDETSDMRPFFDIAKDIYNNIEQYKSTYDLLEDETSKNVLIGLLTARLTGDSRHLTDLTSRNSQYFDKDIIKAYENEVIVDGGGYIGDTIEVLLKTPEARGNIKRIYLYEPDEKNLKQAKKNLRKASVEIIFRKAGLSDKRDSLFITGTGKSAHITDHGPERDKVDIVTLDEDIKERVTFIKMDIEGSEKAALQGCRKHILEDAPKLAICVYHKLDDVWRVPQYVKSLHPDYKFYLRHHRPVYMDDYVLYCLPC